MQSRQSRGLLAALCPATLALGGCQLLLIPIAGLCSATQETWPDAQVLQAPIVLRSPAGTVFTVSHLTVEGVAGQDGCVASASVETADNGLKTAAIPSETARRRSEDDRTFLTESVVREVKSVCNPSRVQYTLRSGVGPSGFRDQRNLRFKGDGTYEVQPPQLCAP